MTNILVTTSRGLDDLLADEIQHILGHVEIKRSPGCIAFDGNLEHAYRLCLWSRLANRVLFELAQGTVKDAESLYDLAQAVDWPAQFTNHDTFVVNFSGTNRAINNSQFGAQKVKDAIVDAFVEDGQSRPQVDKRAPDMTVYARCRREQISIGIDLSGKSLHQRAYRIKQGAAPVKEHVAAAMLMRSGWAHKTDQTLVDPMCGSGTLVIEAAMMKCKIAPGLSRDIWGFSHWQGHQPRLWNAICESAKDIQLGGIEETSVSSQSIYASDNDPKMIAIAKRNADIAGVFQYINFSVNNATKWQLQDVQPGFIVSNPPFGERLSDLSVLVPLFNEWGVNLKTHWHNWRLSLLTSKRELLRAMKLRASKEYALMNGKLECKLVNFDLSGDNLEQISEDISHPFVNRVQKNLKRLKPFLKRTPTDCYRVYDADLPEYNVAIDRYGDFAVVQEYAPPASIDEHKAKRRLQDVMLYLPAALKLSADNIVLKVREQQKGQNQYNKQAQTGRRIEVVENGAKYWANLWDYLDTGLFLDHRNTRDWIRQNSKNKNVLNLFCYTGSISVAAAQGGAKSVTSVDLSQTYLNWAKDNFKLNGIRGPHAFVQADCVTWLAEQHSQFDLIVIDPPSFSNSKRMSHTWDVQRDYLALLADAKRCLADKGTIVFSNNKRGFKLDNDAVLDIGLTATNKTKQTIPEDFSRNGRIHQCWHIFAC